MEVLVFRTNIQNQRMADYLKPILDSPSIATWSVDTEDCDNVLRIVSLGLSEKEIIHQAKDIGIVCEILPD
jgi:hypothetical protein